MKSRFFPLMAACLLGGLAVVSGGQPVPVIYSTDLTHPHVDPDDHFDLACLYAMPEADIRAIILDQGQLQAQRPGYKAVWQMNYLTQRHVPAAIGLRDKLKNPEDQALDQPAEFQNGVSLILQSLQNSPEKAVVFFVGSARDVVAAYNREPGLFREKVRCIMGFIGEASDPANVEYNVQLDPQAFIRLVRSGLPFYWVPCFDGGIWKNNGHASFWRIHHRDVLDQTAEPLQRYFLYMLRTATNDPIAYLSQPTDPADRAWMMNGERNLWCCPILGLPLGRSLEAEGQPVVRFSPVELTIDGQAVIHYGKSTGSRSVMRFEIIDQSKFAAAATRATAELLRAFPLRR